MKQMILLIFGEGYLGATEYLYSLIYLGYALAQLPASLLSVFRHLKHYLDRNSMQKSSIDINRLILIDQRSDIKLESNKSSNSVIDSRIHLVEKRDEEMCESEIRTIKFVTPADLEIEKQRTDKLESEVSWLLHKIEMFEM